MTQRPASSVVTLRVRPVAVLVAVTVAPGSTACCPSATTPSRANVGFCANATGVAPTITTSSTASPYLLHIAMNVPPVLATRTTKGRKTRPTDPVMLADCRDPDAPAVPLPGLVEGWAKDRFRR